MEENEETNRSKEIDRDEDNSQEIFGSYNEAESFQKLLLEREKEITQLKLALRVKEEECKALKIDAEKNERTASDEMKMLKETVLDLENIIERTDEENKRLRKEQGKNRNVPSPIASDDETRSPKRRKPTECKN